MDDFVINNLKELKIPQNIVQEFKGKFLKTKYKLN